MKRIPLEMCALLQASLQTAADTAQEDSALPAAPRPPWEHSPCFWVESADPASAQTSLEDVLGALVLPVSFFLFFFLRFFLDF